MTARYRMERNPDSGKNGNKMPLHPRLIPYETVSLKKLMKICQIPLHLFGGRHCRRLAADHRFGDGTLARR